MEAVIKACGTVTVALCASLIIGEKYKALAYFASAAALVSISLFFASEYAPVFSETFSAFSENTYFSDYAVTLIKALGVAYITSVTSVLCDDAGEKMLSTAADLAGKVSLMILALPSVSTLLELSSGML